MSGSAGQAQVVIGQLGQRQGKKSGRHTGEIKGKLEPMKTNRDSQNLYLPNLIRISPVPNPHPESHKKGNSSVVFFHVYNLFDLISMTIIHKFLFGPLSYPNIPQILQMNVSRR